MVSKHYRISGNTTKQNQVDRTVCRLISKQQCKWILQVNSLHQLSDRIQRLERRVQSSASGEGSSNTQTQANVSILQQLRNPNFTWEDVRDRLQSIKRSIYYGESLPLQQVFDGYLSYARFIDLLDKKKIKRIYLLGDGRMAIVEVAVDGTCSNLQTQQNDPDDVSIKYMEQLPEWKMERFQFYVELPGDFWEDRRFLHYIKRNIAHRTRDNKIKYDWLLREDQVTPELQVCDPSDIFLPIAESIKEYNMMLFLVALRISISFLQYLGNILVKLQPKKSQKQSEFYAARATEFNVPNKSGRRNDTGVRFADVAGIDAIKEDMIAALQILLGDKSYQKLGCNPPTGILLEGPPGTGKTHLAKAMAGEAGIPFYACSGSEFMEMYSGVASSRIKDIFEKARENAPSIIFIDEIDAIGRARTSGFVDPGTQEREQGLCQLLVEMDGIVNSSSVLVLGATNRKDILDQALLRPGRFDRQLYLGNLGAEDRYQVLKVHCKNKPIDSSGNDEWETDAALRAVAGMSLGLSGADLANICNEAAIISVRRNHTKIFLSDFVIAMEKQMQGLPHPTVPQSPSKQHLAVALAGKAVALLNTPGIPLLEQVSTLGRGKSMAYVRFEPRNVDRNAWQALNKPGTSADPNTDQSPTALFEFCAGLLVPLYAGRVSEELVYGQSGASLMTTFDLSEASNLAWWLVARSGSHPVMTEDPTQWFLAFNDWQDRDATTSVADSKLEVLYKQLTQCAYNRCKEMLSPHKTAISNIATSILDSKGQTLTGKQVLSILSETPLDKVEEPKADPNQNDTRKPADDFIPRNIDDLLKAQLVVTGDLGIGDLAGDKTLEILSQRVQTDVDNKPTEKARLEACLAYATGEGTEFPPPPEGSFEFKGNQLDDWGSIDRQALQDQVSAKLRQLNQSAEQTTVTAG